MVTLLDVGLLCHPLKATRRGNAAALSSAEAELQSPLGHRKSCKELKVEFRRPRAGAFDVTPKRADDACLDGLSRIRRSNPRLARAYRVRRQ